MIRKKVLIVDDEKGFTAMLSLNLESTGQYDVRVENDPSNALASAIQYRPDVILLDVIMPRMEGPDVAIAIRNNPSLHETPIIFLTATVTKEETEAQKGRIGGHPFVAKPSNLAVLLHSMEKNMAEV